MKNLDNEILVHYIDEIIMHSFGVKKSFEELHKLINNEDTKQTKLVWFALNSLLSHSSMISKYIHPISKKTISKERAKKLKKILKITNNSELISRETRDNIEHFDERIDKWIDLKPSLVLEIVVNNRKGFEFFNTENKNIKRVLLRDEMIFITENRNNQQIELELNPIYTEIININKNAEEWLSTFSPYSYIYPN